MTTYSIKPIKFTDGELMIIQEALDLLSKQHKKNIPFDENIEKLERYERVKKEILRKINNSFQMESTYISGKK